MKQNQLAENWFLGFIDWAARTRWMMALVILTCLGVGGWGFYAYYGPQFEWIGTANWFVFPFVPDCPLFVYLFAFVVIGKYVGVESPTFTAFVALGNIKYGVWTVFVLLYYFDNFFGGAGAEAWFRGVILALHVGMVPLGILLWRSLPSLRPVPIAAVLGALLVYDYFDYFFTLDYQVYPVGLPNHRSVYAPYTWQELGLVPWFTIAESFLLAGGLYVLNATTSRRVIERGVPAATPAPRP
ncbi:MAG: DUF1405 domain-containing protein [Euryarchaeota archaeon]|nr:DUF1405 domain-containing protein [Euryarchaeota archaeon]